MLSTISLWQPLFTSFRTVLIYSGNEQAVAKGICQKHFSYKCTIRCRWNPLESNESPRTGISTCVALFRPLFTSSPLRSFTSTLCDTLIHAKKFDLKKPYRYCLTSFLALLLLLTFKLTVSRKIETRSHTHTHICKLLLLRWWWWWWLQLTDYAVFGKNCCAKIAMNIEVECLCIFIM